ncbi:hypothetical protein ADK86_01735 [Streptomyces sp. NRRL F-5755]|uniref:hypothetical protein n=1 Tax=Streptomyces sp. NRRL F-5755 TaxID=1519475 RepID=UPI0006B024B1|nr:hypothetical protein [Streptomyces sp. NRRL F-5755]KOU09242.1 hypothetical protein ADK86_01735 [Streptomyces sp. NRRL F-5755]
MAHPTRFRMYYEDEDLWLHFETDEEGWAARHIEIRGKDARPVTAASLEEVLHLRDHADIPAMLRYEHRYGVLAEGPLDGWQDQPHAAELTAEEFDRLWAVARRTLEGRAGLTEPAEPAVPTGLADEAS